MKTTIALIAFHDDAINIRALSAFLKGNGFETLCFFCQGTVTDGALAGLTGIMKREKAALAGISLVTDDFAKAVAVTRAVRKECAVPVVWGGSHADVMADECLAYADMVCKGEGEEALLELAQAIEARGEYAGIANIWSRAGGVIARNAMRGLQSDLDRYPFPEFDSASHYYLRSGGFEQGRSGRSMYNIMGSRGCPYCCRYCYNNYRRSGYEGKGSYVRLRSVKNIIEELSLAKETYAGLRQVNFWDDSFFLRGREEFLEFSGQYKLRVGIPFSVLGEPMAFDPEKLRILAGCGLRSIQMGLQTGSDRVNQEVYNRRVSADQMRQVAVRINEAGVKAKYDIIFNNPYETEEDVRQTLRMLLDFPRPFSLDGFNLIFYPGTQLTGQALADGFITPKPPEGEDFSAIQSDANSPLTAWGGSVVSSRFYAVRYSSRQKEYLNTLFCLLNSRFIPRTFFERLIKTKSGVLKVLVRMCVPLYLFLVRLKNARKGAA